MTAALPLRAILVADDDEEDRLFMQEALAEVGLAETVRFVADGEELLDYLYRRGSYAGRRGEPQPDLILLDLKMPRKDGFETLRAIRNDTALAPIRVVVLTTSQSEDDLTHAYDLGGNLFVTKPMTYQGLVNLLRVLGGYWGGPAAPPASLENPG